MAEFIIGSPLHTLAKYLKHYHLKHHYSGEGGRYGVSSPVGDWGFGTDPGRN